MHDIIPWNHAMLEMLHSVCTRGQSAPGLLHSHWGPYAPGKSLPLGFIMTASSMVTVASSGLRYGVLNPTSLEDKPSGLTFLDVTISISGSICTVYAHEMINGNGLHGISQKKGCSPSSAAWNDKMNMAPLVQYCTICTLPTWTLQ